MASPERCAGDAFGTFSPGIRHARRRASVLTADSGPPDISRAFLAAAIRERQRQGVVRKVGAMHQGNGQGRQRRPIEQDLQTHVLHEAAADHRVQRQADEIAAGDQLEIDRGRVALDGPPVQLMKMVYTDRFFYILYFQQVGPPEAELGADARRTMSHVLYGASGEATAGRAMPTELPPMEGTGFLTMMSEPPALPYMGPEGAWLTEAELDLYAGEFTHSGFFGPVSWYRNLDANATSAAGLGADRLTMPSFFITGDVDVVRLMDPTGPERMRNLLPDYRGEVIIPGSGHWVQQETPSAFNDALLGFLRTL